MNEIRAKKQLNRGLALTEIGIFLLILNVLFAVHLWEAVKNHWQVAGEGLLLEQAWVSRMNSPIFNVFDINSCYVYLLHTLFLFFGNHQAVVLLTNMFLQFFAIFLFYRGCRRLTNRVVALIAAGVLSIVSFVDFSVVLDDAHHLAWFVCCFVFWLISFAAPLYTKLVKKEKKEAAKTRTAEPLENPMKEAREFSKDMHIEAKPEALKKASDKRKPEASENATKEPEKGSSGIQYIPNPLPVPKKHVKKEMDYAFEPPPEKMHYDLNNYSVDDDYDIKGI